MKTSADILLGDWHIGHKRAIMYPDPNIDYRANDKQRWLFKCYQSMLDDIDGILETYKVSYIHALFGGDMGDLDYKMRGSGKREYWASTSEEVVFNASQLLDPLMKLVDDAHFLMGNDAHVGVDGTLDNVIAEDFANAVPLDEKRNEWAWPGVDYEIQGKLINSVHKGKNKTKWTDVNGLSSLSAEVLLDRVKDSERIPDILVRFHFHYGLQLRDLHPHPISVAPFQLKSDFIRYIDAVDGTPKVGGHILIFGDGELIHTEPLLYKMPRRAVWRKK
jgi:hypothetical protein